VEDRGRPVVTASALHDEGVLRTFFVLARLTWDDLDRRHGLAQRFQLTREAFLEMLGAVFGKRL
jgi:hypothetical protein